MRQYLPTDVLTSKIPLQHRFDCKASTCILDPMQYLGLTEQSKLFSVTRKKILVLNQHNLQLKSNVF